MRPSHPLDPPIGRPPFCFGQNNNRKGEVLLYFTFFSGAWGANSFFLGRVKKNSRVK